MKINDRVMWLKYAYDGTISETGFGLILEVSPAANIIILCDNGKIESFDAGMLKLYKEWDEKQTS